MVEGSAPHPAYKQAGIDTDEAEAGLANIVGLLKRTWPKEGLGRVRLDIGYFANVLDIGGVGIALCTDGVGSKTVVAQMTGRYDTIGIDCVAMNVNDLICVGARPVSLVDYIAVERADADMLAQIGRGLYDGARAAGISVSGGEIAQLKDTVRGFDLVGTAVGHVALDRILTGQGIRAGDVVIGMRSSGIHSNGLSLARRAFFELNGFDANARFDELDRPLGEELLTPTAIYVPEALALLDEVPGLKALVNVTGDGLLNLTRVSAAVGFVLDDLPEPQPVFGLIQRLAGVGDAEMFEVFNMGVGFCAIVDPGDADAALAVLGRHGRAAQPIGRATADPEKKVWLPDRKLLGKGKAFARAARPD